MQGTAIFSPCGRYRYLLTRQWHAGDPALCAWWGLNPSKADAEKNDLTISKMCGFSQRWGFGGLIVVNMFALISTNPKIMVTDHDPVGGDLDAHLWALLRLDKRVTRIVCCWGNLPTREKRLWCRVDDWARKLKADPRAVCLGRTKTAGEPRHPSRLGYATDLEPLGISQNIL